MLGLAHCSPEMPPQTSWDTGLGTEVVVCRDGLGSTALVRAVKSSVHPRWGLWFVEPCAVFVLYNCMDKRRSSAVALHTAPQDSHLLCCCSLCTVGLQTDPH